MADSQSREPNRLLQLGTHELVLRLHVRVLGCVLLLAAMAASCDSKTANEWPFARFGVDVGDVPATAAQLDELGPVWYMDYHWDTPTLAAHGRLFIVHCNQLEPNAQRIGKAMQAGGASWWSLGNEPNDPNQDNVTPEEYAALYHQFESLADEAPQCRLVPAGLGNADWRWAAEFRQIFERKYGHYPKVYAWNIHDYMLEAHLDPYDVDVFKHRIVEFRHWMESIGDGHKPLLLSEFGVLYGSGCCNRPVDPPEKIREFMQDTTTWLVESNTVAAWAWFASDARPYNGSLFDTEGRLNELGALYRDLAQAAGERGER